MFSIQMATAAEGDIIFRLKSYVRLIVTPINHGHLIIVDPIFGGRNLKLYPLVMTYPLTILLFDEQSLPWVRRWIYNPI